MKPNKMNAPALVLNKLHDDAKRDPLRAGKGIMKSIFRPIQPADFANVYLPISKEQGITMQNLIVENGLKEVVEFGTSFGISTIYLANAVRHTGGKVISTELIEAKAKRAMQHIREADLESYVELRVGDAMETLKGYDAPIDFLFLDGWKDLYLPLFKMLESNFHAGTLIYADNMDMHGTKPYADYILDNRKYTNEIVDGSKAFLTSVSSK